MDTGIVGPLMRIFHIWVGQGVPEGREWGGTGRGVLVPPRALTFRGQLEVKPPASAEFEEKWLLD